MKCPVCGKETITVVAHIDHPADILGCDDCLPPEIDGEYYIELCECDLDDYDFYDDEEDEYLPPYAVCE